MREVKEESMGDYPEADRTKTDCSEVVKKQSERERI